MGSSGCTSRAAESPPSLRYPDSRPDRHPCQDKNGRQEMGPLKENLWRLFEFKERDTQYIWVICPCRDGFGYEIRIAEFAARAGL